MFFLCVFDRPPPPSSFVRAGVFRGGGLMNSEHMCKYNALLAIANEDAKGSTVPFAGAKFRNPGAK